MPMLPLEWVSTHNVHNGVHIEISSNQKAPDVAVQSPQQWGYHARIQLLHPPLGHGEGGWQ